VAVAAVVVAGWMVSGPLRPGWNAVANNGHGSGARVALAGSASPAAAASAVQLPFRASLNGTATQVGGQGGFGPVTVRVDSTLSGGVQGSLTILLEGMSGANGGLAVQRTDVIFTPAASSESFEGQLASMQGDRLSALCTDSAGERVRLDMQLQVDDSGNVSGTVRGSRA
jgi:hypothetical protein